MIHRLRRRPLLIASLAPCLLPTLARANDPVTQPALDAVVDAAIRPLLARHDIPGMAVGVTVGGARHVYHYGMASRGSGAAVANDTLFELGSLSKTFTATLAAYAEALGQLSLDDSIGRTVPALRNSPIGAASLLHLGTYTAGGLPLQFPDSVADLPGAMALYRAFTPTARPGAQRRYSNPSIGLLGHAAAQAMRRDFTGIAQADLFPGLGLRQTFIRVPDSRLAAYAWGHDKAGHAVRVNPGVFDAQAYGVKSTVGDMLRWMEVNIDPSLLQGALRAAVERTQVGHFSVGPLVQGLGWEQYPFPVALDQLQAGNAATMALEPHPAQAISPPGVAAAPTLFNKTGSTNGFGAYAAFVPARRAGVVMLANRNFPNAARIEAAHAILAHATAG